MEMLLILFSLVLHVITFIIIRIQTEKISFIKDKEEEQRNQSKEMEELLSAYLYEMKEENDRLFSLLQTEQEPTSSIPDRGLSDKNSEVDNKKYRTPKKNDPRLPGSPVPKTNHDYLYTPPVQSFEEDSFEKSTSLQVYTLYKEGESIENIAKKLNCGKTEIELMLKFYQEA